MRDIVYLSLITILVFAISFPEAIGRWQARRDIAYDFAWEGTIP
jgi:hypothetical protein